MVEFVLYSAMNICVLTVNETKEKIAVLLRAKKAKYVVHITTVKQYSEILVLS